MSSAKTKQTRGNSASSQPEPFLQRRAPWLLVALLAIATFRIAATYPIYSYTVDELPHIACGMEWLSEGVYGYEAQHPPLARVMAALGPYLAGARTLKEPDMGVEGAMILLEDGRYEHRLTLARLGILPFFWLATCLVYLWGRRWFDTRTGLFAAALFTLTPPVLAHAGLATTDMALTAAMACGLYTLLAWLENPGWRQSALLAASLAFLVLAKFSSLVFFPAALLLLAPLAWKLGVKVNCHPLRLAAAALAALLLIWAGYRFSFGPTVYGFRAPAPELFAGIEQVRAHNAAGHLAYLLGQRSMTGFPHFYLVALAVKTPLPLLALAALGLPLLWRRRNLGALAALTLAAALLLIASATHIQIGIRHILPIYVTLALAAGAALSSLLDSPRKHFPAIGYTLASLLLLSNLLAHPDYLPYFNLLAGSEPERILADSDLDWGQDMKRLGLFLESKGVRRVAMEPLEAGYLPVFHGIQVTRPRSPLQPEPGWNAVSMTMLKTFRLRLFDKHPEARLWPESAKPAATLGAGVKVYYFEPSTPSSQPPR